VMYLPEKLYTRIEIIITESNIGILFVPHKIDFNIFDN
jgi:hypothetical protein